MNLNTSIPTKLSSRHKSGLIGPAIILMMAVLLSLGSRAHAQIAVSLKMSKNSYILNEPVSATIQITNHAGRQLVFQGNSSRPWLTFHLVSNGKAVPIARRMNYNALVIPAGQTVSRNININSSYSLGRMGNYTCTATVNMPGPTRNGFTSNRDQFTITGGRTIWVQRAGIPNAPGEIREYKLLTFSGNRALELYAQVSSSNSGLHIATIPLGKLLTMRKPTGTLDSANNMHALYQVKPNVFTHVTISPSGKLLSSTHHKRGKTGGDPRLYALNGAVVVAGAIPYSPEAEAAQRNKIRSISERPPFIFRK
jgi:hypothetical protein